MSDDIVLTLAHDDDLSALEGRTFQVHLLPGKKIRLYPVTLPESDLRCPAIIGGERCAERAGARRQALLGRGRLAPCPA